MKPHLGELVFFFVLLLGASLLSFAVMSPYITPIFLAGVFTILFSPLHVRIKGWIGGRETLAALSTVVVVLFIVLIPLVFLVILMSQEVLSVYGALRQGNGGVIFIDRAANAIEQYVRTFVPSFELHANIYVYLEAGLRWVGGNLNAFLSGILSFAVELILVLIGMFFFYRDGKKLHEFALKWSPLADNYDEGIIAKIQVAVDSVVKGALTTAIIQGALVGVGFFIFGIANPIFWGVIATVAAFVPVVGSAIITVPAGIVLILSGNLWSGIGLICWALFFVGLIDNVTRPMLIHRGVDIHPFIIFLSVIGGLVYFGPVGFLAGPIVLAFFFALLDIYPLIVKGRAIDGTKVE